MIDAVIPPQSRHAEAEEMYIAIARKLTPAQQLATLHGLQQSAWALKASMVRSEHPELSEQEVNRIVRDSFVDYTP
ncbi:MAG: hypothetical protein ABI026_02470 [Gemmatimonadaceae bacterium]